MDNRLLKYIIVHCSAGNWGNRDYIDRIHRHRGWRMIGYHKIICGGFPTWSSWRLGRFDSKWDGLVEDGRPLNEDHYIEPEEIGAHALGYNAVSAGICLIGKRHFTLLQFVSLLEQLILMLEQHPHLRIENILGHDETPKGAAQGKTCPNFNMNVIRYFLKRGGFGHATDWQNPDIARLLHPFGDLRG